ncbi:flagellar motor switch protein FliN [Deltaproteobacteria bacterium TL4]
MAETRALGRAAMLGGDSISKLLDDDEVYHTIKFLEDVPMIMNVEIGRTDMRIRDVLNLKKGSVVEFNKIVGEPVDVLVAERLMARGEVVVVNERYGVRISEVTRPDEKIGDRRE